MFLIVFLKLSKNVTANFGLMESLRWGLMLVASTEARTPLLNTCFGRVRTNAHWAGAGALDFQLTHMFGGWDVYAAQVAPDEQWEKQDIRICKRERRHLFRSRFAS